MFRESHINPNELIPTEKWHINDPNVNISELYIKNVLYYPQFLVNDLMNQKINDLANIERLKNSHFNQSYRNEIQFYNDDLISLNYETQEPRLKFIHKRTDNLNPFEVKFELLKSLVDYADKRDYFGPNVGCHICLKVTNDLSGYLQFSGEEFYKIHPLREIFLNNFSNLNVTYIRET